MQSSGNGSGADGKGPPSGGPPTPPSAQPEPAGPPRPPEPPGPALPAGQPSDRPGPAAPASQPGKSGRPARSGRAKRLSGGRSPSGNYAPLPSPQGPKSSPGQTSPSIAPEPRPPSETAAAPRERPPAPLTHSSSPSLLLSGTPRRPTEPKKSRRRSRLRHLAALAELPAKIPEKIEEGIEKGIEGIGKGVNATVDILKDPIGSVQQVVDALQAPRGLAMGWALALILPIIIYLLDLGAGSLWQGADAQFALALQALAKGELGLDQAARTLPPPQGSPLGLWQMMLTVRLLGVNEATLRLLPVLAALGSAMCLLAISIDVGVGRHAGGLAGLVLLALPLTYELSHRVLPDMLVAFASTSAVALVSHSLHGHKFDRHILPMHRDSDAPEPLPLRRLPMLFATLGIGLSALVDPRAGVIAIAFGLLDILISHRYLLRKRRVWLMLGGALLLTLLATLRHPTEIGMWLRWPNPGVPLRTFQAIWHQGDTWFSRHIGPVVIVATGFGLLLGSLRRASRSLLVWVLVAVAMTWFGDDAALPRGLGLVLPPLALCAAVGLQSPVRWLGALGGVITTCALAGVVVVNIEGGAVLHNSDTIKILTQSQQHAPSGALLCTVGIRPEVSTFYAHRPIAQFNSVDELARALTPGQLFSCLIPPALLDEVQRRFAPPAARPARPAEPAPPRPGRRPAAQAAKDSKDSREAREPKGREAKDEPPEGIGSVLATTLDIEEAPLDTQGPKVILVSR